MAMPRDPLPDRLEHQAPEPLLYARLAVRSHEPFDAVAFEPVSERLPALDYGGVGLRKPAICRGYRDERCYAVGGLQREREDGRRTHPLARAPAPAAGPRVQPPAQMARQ